MKQHATAGRTILPISPNWFATANHFLFLVRAVSIRNIHQWDHPRKDFMDPVDSYLTDPNGPQWYGRGASTAMGVALAGSQDSLGNFAPDAGENGKGQAEAIVRTMIARDPSVAM